MVGSTKLGDAEVIIGTSTFSVASGIFSDEFVNTSWLSGPSSSIVLLVNQLSEKMFRAFMYENTNRYHGRVIIWMLVVTVR